MNVLGTATDEHPVLYDVFYIVQYLLDIEDKFIPKVNSSSLTILNKMAITSNLFYTLSGCLE